MRVLALQQVAGVAVKMIRQLEKSRVALPEAVVRDRMAIGTINYFKSAQFFGLIERLAGITDDRVNDLAGGPALASLP